MKRFLAAACGLLLFLSPLQLSAITPTYQPSRVYQRSRYYERLCLLPASGDAAVDTVAVAMTQLGYREGSSASELGGSASGSARNFTEYNYALGKIGGTYSYAWCAAFVSWCLEETHSMDAAGGAFASCTLWVERLQALGRYRTRASGYTPPVGDLIFFRSPGVTRASDHVGLVRYVAGGRVFTVEGNSSNAVMLHDYALTDTYIVGYGHPKYSGLSLSLDPGTLSGKVPGWYTVTNTTLNLRKGPSTSYQKAGQLGAGALLRVTELRQGWGQIEHGGKKLWISLQYTQLIAPLSLRVTYRTEGEERSETHFSTEEARIPDAVPAREGARFLYWEGSDGVHYAPGTLLPPEELTLTAVFEALPEVELPGSDLPGDSFPGEISGESSGTESAGEVPPMEAPAQGDPAPSVEGARSLAATAAGVVTGSLTVLLGALALYLRYGRRRQ